MSRISCSVKTDDVVRVSAKNSGKRNIYIPAKNRVCAGSGGQNSGIGQNSGKFAVHRLNDVVEQI
jgi:hypothetical protein